MTKYLKTREGSLEDLAKQMQNKVIESDYQDKFKKELDKAGRPIGQMTGAEKKAFFNKLDKMHSAKNEQVKNPYAIGMAQAMKAKDDQPPLKKSTITKAHDIAKSIEKDQKEEVEIKEEDAYQNDRFAVSGNSAKIDNTNTRDKSNHIYAPNAKTAVAMYKAGVKSYKDTTDMRKKFPMAVEEVINEKKTFKEVYKKTKKEAMNTTGDATVDNANQNLEPTEKPENDPDVKVAKKKTDVGSKTTGVDTSPEIAYKN